MGMYPFPSKYARGTRTRWLCENIVGFTNSYCNWLSNEKVSEKRFTGYGLLSLLWKELDAQNESSEAVEVPVDTFATLIEQTTLLWSQASLSVLYTCHLKILKTCLKDPRKDITEEKTALLQEDESHLFGKKFQSHIIKIEHSKKKFVEVFKSSNAKKAPFWKGPIPCQNRPQDEGRYYYMTKLNNQH